MSSPTSDTPTGQSANDGLIPGIYHYCDFWCERCPLQERCKWRQDQQTYETLLMHDHAGLDACLMGDGWDSDRHDGGLSLLSTSERLAYLAIADRQDPPLPEEEHQRAETALEQKTERQEAHPLAVAASEYADAVRNELVVLQGSVLPAEEPRINLAFETVVRHAERMANRAARAAGGLVGGLFGDESEEDLRGVQSDANGCAKLLRLLIAESWEAWNELAGDEQTAELEPHMLGHLGHIRDLVSEYFPRAMEFVRPGFDDGEAAR